MTTLSFIWNLNDRQINDYLNYLNISKNDPNYTDYDMRRIQIAFSENELDRLTPEDKNIVDQDDFIQRVIQYPTIEKVIESYKILPIISQDYFIFKNLGEGAFGTAYLALKKNTNDHNIYVLKEIDFQVEYLNQEIDVLNRLVPYCGEYIICFEGSSNYLNLMGENKIYIITDYSDDFISLDIFLKTNFYNNKFNEFINQNNFEKIDLLSETYINIFNNLCEGLKLIHSKGIVHRDIKPANLLINPKNNSIKYLDFGFAIYHERINDPINQEISGTKEYLDPMLQYKKYFSQNSISKMNFYDYQQGDLFSLAVVIFESLVGTTHFEELYSLIIEDIDDFFDRSNIYQLQQEIINIYGEINELNFEYFYIQKYDINNPLFQTENLKLVLNYIFSINSDINLNILMSRNFQERRLYC